MVLYEYCIIQRAVSIIFSTAFIIIVGNAVTGTCLCSTVTELSLVCVLIVVVVFELLSGYNLQLSLLVILLGQLGKAGQGCIYFLDGQQALGGRRKCFALFEEHPHRLRYIPLKKKDSNCVFLWNVSRYNCPRRESTRKSFISPKAHKS